MVQYLGTRDLNLVFVQFFFFNLFKKVISDI